MKRIFIFSVLFPPLALAVFTAPDAFKNYLDWMVYAYVAAMIPAWLTAVVDWKLSANRVVGTALAGAAITGAISAFLWGGFRELFPAVMALLVGAIPAAVCSCLSGKVVKAEMAEAKAGLLRRKGSSQ